MAGHIEHEAAPLETGAIIYFQAGDHRSFIPSAALRRREHLAQGLGAVEEPRFCFCPDRNTGKVHGEPVALGPGPREGRIQLKTERVFTSLRHYLQG
jgi:hypothetical protein